MITLIGISDTEVRQRATSEVDSKLKREILETWLKKDIRVFKLVWSIPNPHVVAASHEFVAVVRSGPVIELHLTDNLADIRMFYKNSIYVANFMVTEFMLEEKNNKLKETISRYIEEIISDYCKRQSTFFLEEVKARCE